MSVWGGAAAMDRFKDRLEGTGLVEAGVSVVAAIFVVHVLAALRRLPFRVREVRAFARTAGSLRHWDTISWGLQVASALVVGVLGAIHVWVAGDDLPVEAVKSALRVHDLARTGFYDLLLSAVAVHTALGLDRLATKWGFPGRTAARVVAWACFGFLVVVGFGTLVLFHRIARGG
jgi:fumarate reductase subunit C